MPGFFWLPSAGSSLWRFVTWSDLVRVEVLTGWRDLQLLSSFQVPSPRGAAGREKWPQSCYQPMLRWVKSAVLIRGSWTCFIHCWTFLAVKLGGWGTLKGRCLPCPWASLIVNSQLNSYINWELNGSQPHATATPRALWEILVWVCPVEGGDMESQVIPSQH